MRRVVIAFVLSVSMMSWMSCASPDSYEQFILIDEKGEDDLYHFSLDFSDSLYVYDLSFFSRIDCNNLRLVPLRDFPLIVTWTSPEGKEFEERVYFKIQEYAQGSVFYSHQYVIPYRSDIVPAVRGTYSLAVRIDSDSLIPGFRGLGVICNKKKSDGTQEVSQVCGE